LFHKNPSLTLTVPVRVLGVPEAEEEAGKAEEETEERPLAYVGLGELMSDEKDWLAER
jgi:hypothetical protein